MSDIGSSIKAEIRDGALHITIPLADVPTRSSTGKSMIVASTGGFQRTDAKVGGTAVSVSVNAIVKAPLRGAPGR